MSNDTARLVGKQLGLQTPEMKGYQPWSSIVERHIAASGAREAHKVARLVTYHHAVNAWNKEFRQHVSAVLRSKGWEPLHSDDPLSTPNSTADNTNNTDNTDTADNADNADNTDQLDDEALDEVGVDEGEMVSRSGCGVAG